MEEAEKTIDDAKESLIDNAGIQHAVVIDGLTLAIVLSGSLKEKFLDLASRCKSVICCRVSPKQKAQITYLVKVYKIDSSKRVTWKWRLCNLLKKKLTLLMYI